jgi:hypothetical protein
MDVKRLDADRYGIELTSMELIIICNCINEVCNGITVSDFDARIGAEMDVVECMLRKLRAVRKSV